MGAPVVRQNSHELARRHRGYVLPPGRRAVPGSLLLRPQWPLNCSRGPTGAGMANPAVKMGEDRAIAHKDMANAIRALAMDAVEKAKSGHPGMPMGMADVATVLFTRFLKFDASAPDWPDRDRFVLSAGHGSMLLYALLHLTGYPGMTMDQLSSFRQLELQDGRPSRIRPRRRHRDHHGALGSGHRQRRGYGVGRTASQHAVGRGRRRPLHLLCRRRRLPDGRRQPGGDLAGRTPEAQQAHRAVRRQPDLHRRADGARRLGRPDQALRGLRLGCATR